MNYRPVASSNIPIRLLRLPNDTIPGDMLVPRDILILARRRLPLIRGNGNVTRLFRITSSIKQSRGYVILVPRGIRRRVSRLVPRRQIRTTNNFIRRRRLKIVEGYRNGTLLRLRTNKMINMLLILQGIGTTTPINMNNNVPVKVSTHRRFPRLQHNRTNKSTLTTRRRASVNFNGQKSPLLPR